MFLRIIGGVVLTLVIALIVLEGWVFRGKRSNIRLLAELTPVLGFVGAILIALAFVEAARREVIDAWRWGMVLGFVLAIGVLIARWARNGQPGTGWRGWIRIAQTYGIVLLVGILSVIVAVRVIGALLEVFIASALGMMAVGAAVGIFAASWRKSINSKQ